MTLFRILASRRACSQFRLASEEPQRQHGRTINRNVHDVLAFLKDEDLAVSKQLAGLRTIAQIIENAKRDPPVLYGKDYFTLKEHVKQQVNDFQWPDLVNFAYWLRVIYNFQHRELTKKAAAEVANLIKRLDNEQPIELSTAVPLFFNLSVAGVHSNVLKLQIQAALQDEAQELSLAELKQILDTARYIEHLPGCILANGVLQRLRKVPNKDLQPQDAISFLQGVLDLETTHDLQAGSMTKRLSELLVGRIGVLKLSHLCEILDMFAKHPRSSDMLLDSTSEALVRELLFRPQEIEPFTLLHVYTVLWNTRKSQDAYMKSHITEAAMHALSTQLSRIDNPTLCQILFRVGGITDTLPRQLKEALALRLQEMPQLPYQDLVPAASGIASLSTDLRVEDLLKHKEFLFRSVEGTCPGTLIRALQLLSPPQVLSQYPAFTALKDEVTQALVWFVQDSYINIVKYTRWLNRFDGEDLSFLNQINSIAAGVAFERFERYHVLQQLVHTLQLASDSEWKQIVDKASLTGAQIVSLLTDRNTKARLRAVNYMLKTLPVNSKLASIALGFVTDNESEEDLLDLCEYMNQVNTILTCMDKTVRDFFNILLDRKLVHAIQPFLQTFNREIQHLPSHIRSTPRIIRYGSSLAMIDCLDVATAELLVDTEISDPTLKGPLLLIASKLPRGHPKLDLNFLESLIPRNRPYIDALIEWFMGYLHWPDNSADMTVVELFRAKVQHGSPYTMGLLSNFIKTLNQFSQGIHQELVNTLIEDIAKYTALSSRFLLIDQRVQLLEQFSNAQNVRAEHGYRSLLINLSNNYLRVNNSQKVSMLSSLTRRGIRQRDLTEQIIKDLLLSPSLSASGVVALSALAELGFHQELWAKELIAELTCKVSVSGITGILLSNWLWSLLMINASPDKIGEAIEVKNKAEKSHSFKDILITDYFRLHSPPIDFNQSLTEKESQSVMNTYQPFGCLSQQMQNILDSAATSGIEARTNTLVKGVWAPAYFPQRDIVLWPLTPYVQTYDGGILRGPFAMHKTHLEAVTHKVILTEHLGQESVPNLIELIN